VKKYMQQTERLFLNRRSSLLGSDDCCPQGSERIQPEYPYIDRGELALVRGKPSLGKQIHSSEEKHIE